MPPSCRSLGLFSWWLMFLWNWWQVSPCFSTYPPLKSSFATVDSKWSNESAALSSQDLPQVCHVIIRWEWLVAFARCSRWRIRSESAWKWCFFPAAHVSLCSSTTFCSLSSPCSNSFFFCVTSSRDFFSPANSDCMDDILASTAIRSSFSADRVWLSRFTSAKAAIRFSVSDSTIFCRLSSCQYIQRYPNKANKASAIGSEFQNQLLLISSWRSWDFLGGELCTWRTWWTKLRICCGSTGWSGSKSGQTSTMPVSGRKSLKTLDKLGVCCSHASRADFVVGQTTNFTFTEWLFRKVQSSTFLGQCSSSNHK